MSDFDKPLERTGRSRMHLRRKKDSDAFGRFAESTARFMGSPKFILYMTIFVVTWVAANVVLVSLAGRSWDPYPFILQDRQRAERNLADTEYLTREIAGLRMSMGDVATRDFVRSELRVALEEFDRDREGRLAERDQRIAELQAELDELKAEREEP